MQIVCGGVREGATCECALASLGMLELLKALTAQRNHQEKRRAYSCFGEVLGTIANAYLFRVHNQVETLICKFIFLRGK